MEVFKSRRHRQVIIGADWCIEHQSLGEHLAIADQQGRGGCLGVLAVVGQPQLVHDLEGSQQLGNLLLSLTSDVLPDIGDRAPICAREFPR